MKCENCKKRDATVHLTEIKNGVKQEMHLCEPCAAEKGLPGKAHFSISDLLAGIASAQQAQKGKRAKDIQCPACELTLSQFQSTGRFGCGECYTAFKEEILPLIEKIHDSTQHTGKVPQRASPEVTMQKDLRHLHLELKRAVKREDYERAAQLRDQIKRLEEDLQARGVTPPAQPPSASGRGKA
jgi:protein arginine kinase activator